MAEVASIQQLNSLLTSTSSTVGTTAVQISGGSAALTALGGNAPSRNRQVLRVTNTSATQLLYIGSTSGVTAGAGGGWFKMLNPNEYFDDLCNGSVTRYAIASAASGSMTVEEYQ